MIKLLTSVILVTSLVSFCEANTFGKKPNRAFRVQFNEHVVSDLYQTFPVDDAKKIFGYIFEEMDSEVMVYPTENYYYFSFNSDGKAYSGNFRLSPAARQSGYIHFAYFNTSNPKWFRHLYLGPADGVLVKKIEPLKYEVSYDRKTVTFVLNDISQQSPKNIQMTTNERFVGRTFDESGFVFLLLYNIDNRNFIWILDSENNFKSDFVSLSKKILIDIRSSFIFYHDKALERHVLAGVSILNSIKNNYFDGPFDQLPDNYISETSFAEFVEQAYPTTKGLLNRRGERPDGSSRLAITPYRQYTSTHEILSHFNSCRAIVSLSRLAFYACMFSDPTKENQAKSRP